MVHALEEIRRLLKPDGCLIDIYSIHEARLIKVYHGNDILFVEPDPSYCGKDSRQWEDALAQVVQRGLFAIERDSEFDLAVYGSSVAELQEFYDELEAYDDSPVDEAVEARAKELYNRVENIMQAVGDGAQVAYHERARITRLRPVR